MKKSNKRGFTIVELVIVIAVIAILAAVLIPTFSSIIKKAQTSADIQACRQMNEYLAVNEVTEGTNIIQIYDVLAEGGMTAKDYSPLISDRYYFWDSVENRILYTDKDYNVLYPEEYKDIKSKSVDATNGHQWYSLSGDIDSSAATVEIPSSAPATTQTIAANSAADMIEIAKYIKKFETTLKDKTITIDINADMNLNGADLNLVDGNKSDWAPNVVINGNNHTITGLYISDEHAGLGNDASGKVASNYSCAMFSWVNDLTVKNLTIDSAIVGSPTVKQASIFASHVSGKVVMENVTVKNSKVYTVSKSGLLFGYLTNANYNVDLKKINIINSSVCATEGESGLLFGVLTRAGNNTNDDYPISVKLSDISIDNKSFVSIFDESKLATINGKQYVDAGNKYKNASAKIGFIGWDQTTNATTTLTGEGLKYSGKATNWKAINSVPAETITSFTGYTE